MTHLDYERQSPVWRHWVRELSRGHTLVRYDERGCGLSDREFEGTPTLETFVGDLATVVEAAGLERFALIGLTRAGWGGAVPAFRQVFSATYIPSAGEQQKRWYDELQQASSTGEMAARLWASRTDVDVSEQARRVMQ